MKRTLSFLPAILLATLGTAHAEIPNTIPHQGRVVAGNTNFHGTGGFKFLLFEDDDDLRNNGGEVAIWANDDNDGVPFAEPASSVAIQVRRGLYATHLGSDPMTPLPASVEPAAGKKLYLAIWFDGGTGTFQKLNPDIGLGAVPLALHARSVTAGGVTAEAIADGAVTSAALAEHAVTADKIAAGAVSTLGTPDGTTPDVLNVTNDHTVGLGTTSPDAPLHVASGTALLNPRLRSTVVDNRHGFDQLAGLVGAATSGNLLAVASRNEDSVSLIDISNPAIPVLKSVLTDGIGGFDQLAGAFSVAFSGDILAISAKDDHSVTLVDTGDPEDPTIVRVFTDGVGGYDKLAGVTDAKFAPTGQLVVVAEDDHAVTVIENPVGSPSILVTLEDGQFGFDHLRGARQVAFRGNILMAIAATGDSSVSLINMSNPSNPVLKAVMQDGIDGFARLAGAATVDFDGPTLAIGARDDHAVTLVDTGPIGDPTTTRLATLRDGVGDYDFLAGIRSVTFGNDLLVAVSQGNDAVTFIDTSDPASPQFAGVVRHGSGPFNQLDAARTAVFSAEDPDLLIVTAFGDDSITLIDTAPTASAGGVFDQWLGVGTTKPQAALHVEGGLIVDNRHGLVELNADQLELGVNTTATGDSSLATGRATTAAGQFATATGRNTKADGDYAYSAGRGTNANSAYEFVIGRYNLDTRTQSATEWNVIDRIFAIGNGTSLNDRSNLLTVYKSGYLKLDGQAEFTGGLISGADITADGDLTTSGDFTYETPKTGHLQLPGTAFDSDYVEFNTSNYVRQSDGSIYIANASTSMSFFAAVQLPDGATVTRVEFAYKDNSGDQDYTDIDCYLKRVAFGTTGAWTIASVLNRQTSGQSATPVVVADSNIDNPVIDNATYHYFLQANLEVTLARNQLTFNGARITYTTSKLTP